MNQGLQINGIWGWEEEEVGKRGQGELLMIKKTREVDQPSANFGLDLDSSKATIKFFLNMRKLNGLY